MISLFTSFFFVLSLRFPSLFLRQQFVFVYVCLFFTSSLCASAPYVLSLLLLPPFFSAQLIFTHILCVSLLQFIYMYDIVLPNTSLCDIIVFFVTSAARFYYYYGFIFLSFTLLRLLVHIDLDLDFVIIWRNLVCALFCNEYSFSARKKTKS